MNLAELAERSSATRSTPPTTRATTALETDFPAQFLSRVAEQESWRKEVHRPATSTHKWWAKRLGSVFRGIIASAVTRSADEAIRLYEHGGSLHGTTVFDPFAGSGVTVVEALKLGARGIGVDINPVATLVERQACQAWSTAELDRLFREVEKRCRPAIDRLHVAGNGETVLYYFWVARCNCPECSAPTRLFSSHVFSQHAYPRRVPEAHAVCPVCLDVVATTYDFEQLRCTNGHVFPRKGAVSGGRAACPNGHVYSILSALNGARPEYELYAKLVLGPDGRKHYEAIDDFDRNLAKECETLLSDNRDKLVLPTGSLEDGENTKQAIRWGFTEWEHFFNPRQLYSLGLLGRAIRDLDAPPAEREALAALFSGALEFNNLFCSFKGEGTGAVRHMFSHHILKPERTPLEAHPWGTPASSGSFSTLYERRLKRAQDYKLAPTDIVLGTSRPERVTGVSQSTTRRIVSSWGAFISDPDAVYLTTGTASSTDIPDGKVDLIITDPPYMDNVHYSELADFFHAWLREIGPHDAYPTGQNTTRSPDEVQSPSPEQFEVAIANVWRECHRVLRDDGLIAFSFHQAKLSGWAALVRALASAELVITAIQPIKGEMSTSTTKYGNEPSNLDSIVVCRKRTINRSMPNPQALGRSAYEHLAELRQAGALVGIGDVILIRSQVE